MAALRLLWLTLNSPLPPQCGTATLSWSGGLAPYYPDILNAANTDTRYMQADPAGTTSTSGTWLVSVASGTEIIIRVTDAAGAITDSGAVTVQVGTFEGCLGVISFAPAGDDVYTSTTTVPGQDATSAVAR